MLTLFVLCILISNHKIKPAKAWTGTVYIKADGSIDPPDAPIITYDNVTYTLTDNITSSANGIVVERDNIIIDGGGYTVQGVGAYMSKGIDLTERINVTIKNMKIQNFYIGIRLDGSLNNVVNGNNIANNRVGINLFLSSDNNIIVGNNIKENSERGIMLNGYCLNNVISGNNLINNGWDGITLWSDSNNNTISANMFYGSGLIVGYSYNNVYCRQCSEWQTARLS